MLDRRLLLISIIISGVIASGGVVAADGFSVESENTVPVPERTVDNPQGDGTFTVSEIKTIAPGKSITVDVTAPDETPYFVFFRNDQGEVVIRTDRLDTPQAVTLNTSAEQVGSYVITVGPDSTPKDILPVVIEAYQVTSIETDTKTDESGFTTTTARTPNVSVDLTQQAEEPIEEVNFTVWNKDKGVVEAVSLTLNESADSQHRYRGSLPKLNVGEYNIQVRVQAGDEVNGRLTLIGLSDTQTLTVTEAEGSDSTEQSGSKDGTDGSGGTSQNSDTAENGTDTTSDGEDGQDSKSGDTTDEHSSQSDENNTTNGTDTERNANGTEPGDSRSGENGTNGTNDGVISPNDPNTEPKTNNSVPLRMIPNLLVVVIIAVAVRRIRTE